MSQRPGRKSSESFLRQEPAHLLCQASSFSFLPLSSHPPSGPPPTPRLEAKRANINTPQIQPPESREKPWWDGEFLHFTVMETFCVNWLVWTFPDSLQLSTFSLVINLKLIIYFFTITHYAQQRTTYLGHNMKVASWRFHMLLCLYNLFKHSHVVKIVYLKYKYIPLAPFLGAFVWH